MRFEGKVAIITGAGGGIGMATARIMVGEGARLAAVWNETGVQVNVDKGMTFLEWSPEMKQYVYEEVALGRVLPNWIVRVGPEEIAIWNEVVAPWAKVEIEADGSLKFIE